MKLSVIINTFNEGGRVSSTCKNFLAAGADEVVVFADGTTDGSCDNLPDGARVIKSVSPVGCGVSKVKATSVSTGDVLMWVDAHQSVESGDLRATAKKALSDGTVLCPSLVNIFYRDDWSVERVSKSSHVFYPSNSLLLPSGGQQYGFSKEGRNAAIGVGVCMSRKTYVRVGGWNRFKGRHGSQERGMSLRALMAGVPVEIDDSLCLGHEFYGQDHPSRNGKTGQYRFNNLVPASHNLWHSYQTVLSSSGFSSIMAPWLESLDGLAQGKSATSDQSALQDRDYFLRHCKQKADEYLFDTLSRIKGIKFPEDKGGASLEPAAVHFIKTHASGRCLELGTGSGKGTEALLEGAQHVVSVDHIASYSNASRERMKNPKAEFLTASVKPNGFYDLSSVQGLFDLIVIDGPPGTQARRYSVDECLPLLAYGGCILADDANRDIEGIKEAVQKFTLKLEMLPTRRGLAKITRQAAS